MSESNESQLLRGAIRPTLLVGAAAIIVFTAVKGLSGFYGSTLAQVVVFIYFIFYLRKILLNLFRF